jgi:hypothetical protein
MQATLCSWALAQATMIHGTPKLTPLKGGVDTLGLKCCQIGNILKQSVTASGGLDQGYRTKEAPQAALSQYHEVFNEHMAVLSTLKPGDAYPDDLVRQPGALYLSHFCVGQVGVGCQPVRAPSLLGIMGEGLAGPLRGLVEAGSRGHGEYAPLRGGLSPGHKVDFVAQETPQAFQPGKLLLRVRLTGGKVLIGGGAGVNPHQTCRQIFDPEDHLLKQLLLRR